MPVNTSLFRRVLLGAESAENLPVMPDKWLPSLVMDLQGQPRTRVVPAPGSAPVDLQPLKGSSAGSGQCPLDVNTLLYVLSGMLSQPVITTPGTNGTYVLTLGAQSSGTFTLTFNGQTTSGIAYNADAAAIQTAIEALSTVGVGNVGVSGTGPFTITFRAALERSSVVMTGTFSSLGTPGNASLTTTAATNTRRWTFKPSQWNPDTLKSFSVALGNAVHAAKVSGVKFTTLGLSFAEGGADMSVGAIGRLKLQGRRVQNVALTGGPAGGNFTVSYGAQTTANIAYNATAAAVQAALEALSTIGAGNVTVLGAAPCWQVTFGGALSKTTIGALTGSAAGLTGGSSPAVAIGTCTDLLTVTEVTRSTLAPDTTNVYVGGSILGLTKLRTEHALQTSIDVAARNSGFFDLNSDAPSFGDTVQMAANPTAQLTIEQNTAADALIDDLVNAAQKFLRVTLTGASIETGFVYRVQFTLAFKFANHTERDQDSVAGASFDLTGVYNSDLGTYLEVVVDTALTAI